MLVTHTTSTVVLETERLRLRNVNLADAQFFVRLLNEPSFLENIGDKGVRTVDDAERYLLNGPIASYEKFGFGLWVIELKPFGDVIGICGLSKRDALPDVDIGYALLPQYWSKGYAGEAVGATLIYGRQVLGARRILAITALKNQNSIRLLERFKFKLHEQIRLSEDAEVTNIFVLEPDSND